MDVSLFMNLVEKIEEVINIKARRKKSELEEYPNNVKRMKIEYGKN